MSTAETVTPLLLALAPLALLLPGLVPTRLANAHPRAMARLTTGAAGLALGCALLAVFTHAGEPEHAWTLAAWALPGGIGAFSLSVYANTLTIVMLLLVSFVGVVVAHFGRNYLAGEPRQGYFYRWLALTLTAILTLIVSGNLLLFALAWIATSLSLHQLLLFYRDRPIAVRSAHKKFVVSRIGELSLLVVVLLIGHSLNTLEFHEMGQRMAAWQGPLPLALHLAALLIVLTAGLKSAQLPFHGWLLQVMEAPTPVSALLHAGIVNAGAFIVLRMSPVMAQAEPALALLTVVALLTLAVASLAMLTQTSIKVSLAWSTVGQMGFMLLECGLGLYSLAMLHLVTHSLYKAHAFLSSGSGVDLFRAPAIPKPMEGCRPGALLLALLAGGLLSGSLAWVSDLEVDGQPALLALAAIVAIALAQLLMLAWRQSEARGFRAGMLGLGLILAAAYYAQHGLFEHLLADSVAPVADPGRPLLLALSVLAVLVFLGLFAFQQLFRFSNTRLGEAVYVHLYNGLYIDTWVMRALNRLWPTPAPQARTDHRL